MAQQWTVPELTDEDWQTWFDSPDGSMECPVTGCGMTSVAYWDGINEVLKWTRCKHRAFFPESPVMLRLWPPPDTHIRRDS